MKKDILVIRESIGRIVSMLTEQSVQVTMRGTRAYVSYHPVTGNITGMNIPFIPDDATDEFISAIQGFLDHEVGHVLYSCPKTLIEANKEGKRIANLANIIEDVYIERKMTEGFQGSGSNLESVRKFYLDKIAMPKIKAALSDGDIEAARGYATVAAFRAWGGQATAMDFINQPVIAELVKPVADKLGSEILAQLSLCNSSQDCLILARKCKSLLEKVEPPPPPPPAEDEMLDSMDSRDDLSDSLDSDPAEPEDKGESKVEADDSGKTGSDESDAVDADESKSGDGKGSESGDEKSEDDTDDTDEAADDSPAGVGSKGTEPDTTDAESSDESKGSSEKSSESSTKSSGESSEDSEDLEGSAETDPLADMFDTERNFDDDISKELSKDAGKLLKGSDYAVFSTEWDSVAPAPLCSKDSVIKKMEDSVRDKLGVMQKQLERGVAAQARMGWNPGQRSGRIAPGGLYKTAVGEDRVFRKRYEVKAKNTAVSLVVDCSGSMNGRRIEVAGTAAYALSSVLERLRVTHEVIGFTSRYSGEMTEVMNQDRRYRESNKESSIQWNRVEPLYMPVFKSFSSKLDANAKSRMAHLLESPGWLLQNIDGECVQIAARRLVQQRADRHIMIVLSDGEPAASVSRGLSGHLKKTVAGLGKQGIEVIGIGIQTSSVGNFYPKNVVISDTAELPTRVMTELTKLLLAA